MKRLTYFLIAIFVMGVGLASRKFSTSGSFVYDHLGDAIWAGMIYFGFRMILVDFEAKKSLISAFIFSYLIEISQLYQADWINEIRHTLLGGLVLGFGFLWSDLVMYAIGIFTAFRFDIYFKILKDN